MRYLLPLLLATGLSAFARPASAVPGLLIRTRLYSLTPDAAAVLQVQPPPSRAEELQLLAPPFALRLGDSSVTVHEAAVQWTPAETPPAGVRQIADSELPVGLTGHAVLRCIARSEYMEPLPGGGFALRQLDPASPETPRYVLSFQVEHDGPEIGVRCRAELAVARGRVPVEGVNLPVGKPLVGVFTDEIRFTTREGRWQALLYRPSASFGAGALALLRIERSAAAAEPGPRSDRKLSIAVVADRTAAGLARAIPTAGAPVGYLLYEGGYGEYGTPVAASSPPPVAPIRAAWQDALAHAGYRPATGALPPSIVLVHHWGVTRVEKEVRAPAPAFGDSAAPLATALREKSFVAISAYDHAAFVAGFRTLLWRVQVNTGGGADLPTILPALVTASTSWLGRGGNRRDTATLNLGEQRPIVTPPANNDPAAARGVNEERLQWLVEQEQRTLTRHHIFGISPEERQERRPLP